MVFDIYGLVALIVMALGCGFALWKGDKVEQAGAIMTVMTQLGQLFAQNDTRVLTPQHINMPIDLALLIGFIVLTRKTTRSWPIFAIAFMLIKMVAHGTALLDLSVGAFAYISAMNMADYGVVVTIAIGTWNAWREREALNFANR